MGLGSSEQVGKAIAQALNRVSSLEEDAFPTEGLNSLLSSPIELAKVTTVVDVYKRVISNILTVGHPKLGVVYVYPVYVPLVLGHREWGILGKAYLAVPTTTLVFPMTFPLEFDESYATYSRTLLHTYTS